jgi:hypothetical protein
VFQSGVPAFTGSYSSSLGSAQGQTSGANNFVTITTDGTDGVLTIAGSTFRSASETSTAISADRLSASQTVATTYTIPTVTAGTITVNFYTTTSGATSTTITDTVTITVTDATALLASPTNSTSFIGADSTVAAADVEVTASNINGATQAANIDVVVKNGVGTGTNLSTAVISASIEGPGLLGIGGASAAASGRFVAQSAAAAGSISVWPDNTGTGGTSTIKIYSGTVLIATETLKFHGVVKTLVSKPIRGSISDAAGSGDARLAAVITATDANGVSFKPAHGDLSVAAADVVAAGVTGVTFAAAGGSDRTVSGVALKTTDVVMYVQPTATKTGNKSIKITHTSATSVKTDLVVPFTVGLPEATTVTLTTDKATYLPGEKMVLTLTARDKGGFAIADTTAATDFLAAGGIITSVAVSGDTSTATDPGFVGGKKTWTIYAPLGTGPVTFSGKTGAGALAPTTAVTLTATATVSDSPSMAALTTLINSLIAKINALNKLVIKIQKKVRA